MIDAYVLRSIHRRCNYDMKVVKNAYEALLNERALRTLDLTKEEVLEDTESYLYYYMEQYARSGMADVVILPYIQQLPHAQYLTDAHIDALINIIEGMLEYDPFEVVTVHDEFKCHPNNMNYLRYQYKEILAELSESNILNDILSQLYGQKVQFQMLGTDLGKEIRKSNYALS